MSNHFQAQIAIVLTTVAITLAPAAPRAEDCHADWAEALDVIKREKLVTMEQLSTQARARDAGDILRTTLCVVQGRFVYRLVVRDRKGQLKNLIVDARKPFER